MPRALAGVYVPPSIGTARSTSTVDDAARGVREPSSREAGTSTVNREGELEAGRVSLPEVLRSAGRERAAVQIQGKAPCRASSHCARAFARLS